MKYIRNFNLRFLKGLRFKKIYLSEYFDTYECLMPECGTYEQYFYKLIE